MSNSSTPVIGLGEYGAAPSDPTLLGQEETFEDLEQIAGELVLRKHSGVRFHARLVLNNSGSAILPGKACKWGTDTTYGPGKAVGSLAGDDERPAGFADPFLPAAGVPDGSTFWLIHEGPMDVRYDGSAALAIGDQICTATTGRVREYVSLTDNPESHCGTVVEAKTSGSADTKFRCMVKCKCYF